MQPINLLYVQDDPIPWGELHYWCSQNIGLYYWHISPQINWKSIFSIKFYSIILAWSNTTAAVSHDLIHINMFNIHQDITIALYAFHNVQLFSANKNRTSIAMFLTAREVWSSLCYLKEINNRDLQTKFLKLRQICT